MGEQTNALAMDGAYPATGGQHLRLYCLGSFQMVRPGESEPEDISGKHKLWTLMKYLIVHSEQPVPTSTILDTLWPKRDNPSDTAPLRTAISRLETLLHPGCKDRSDNRFIIYSKDCCAFNPETPFWLDTVEFENICRITRKIGENNHKKGLDLFWQAFELYRGDFLAGDHLPAWGVPLREKYRELFLRTAREASRWAVELQEFQKAVRILKKAVEIGPYDEQLQILLMKTLINLRDFKAAVKHYTFCTHLSYQNRGIEPSPELNRLYKEVQDKLGTVAGSSGVREVHEKSGEGGGPFVCESGLFWNLLLLERRRLARNGGEASLVIVEIRFPKTGEALTNPGFREKSIRHLENAAREKLRKSDVMCRLNQRQLAVLLPMTGLKGGEAAAGNLRECFQSFLQEPGISLTAKVKLIMPQSN